MTYYEVFPLKDPVISSAPAEDQVTNHEVLIDTQSKP